MSDLAQAEAKRASRRLGRYRLSFELASGGMATVYMACTEGTVGFDKVVALKKIHPHLATQKAYVEMFLDEARLASRIQHPNVCSVIDFGQADDSYFLVMEYLVGVPLNKLIATVAKQRELPSQRWPAIASHLMAQAAEGLHAAHELRGADGELLGVVHRDVSPHNLFVGFDGQLRVVDFGIAKAADKIHQTATGEVKGKFSYMAPEQISQGALDRRADVWALGVVLWEMLTLRRLFRRGNDAESMYAVLEGAVEPPGQLVEGIPAALDEVVLRALERDLEGRVPDARTFGRELRRVWTHEHTEPVDSAEVVEFLRALMPGEEERQRSLVELARHDEHSVPKVSQSGGGSTDSFSNLTGSREMPTRKAKPERAPPRRGAGRLAVVILPIVALAAGIALGLHYLESDPETEPGPPLADASREPATPPLRESAATAPETDDEATREPAGTGGDPTTEEEPDPPTEEAEETQQTDALAAAEPTARRGRARRATRSTSAVSSSAAPPTETEPIPTAERAEPAVPSTGRVAIVVPGGWANVYDARGRFLGPTPLTREMPAGRQRLELRFNGEPPPVAIEVDVPAGDVVRISRRPP